jgi:hypothetical protein
MSDPTGGFTIRNLCACMGPYANDPHCPCHMQTLKMDGAYNCFGDKEAMEKRRKDDEERFDKAMKAFGEKVKSQRAGEGK